MFIPFWVRPFSCIHSFQYEYRTGTDLLCFVMHIFCLQIKWISEHTWCNTAFLLLSAASENDIRIHVTCPKELNTINQETQRYRIDGLKNTWAINWNNLLQYKSKISYSTDKTDSNEWTGWKQKQILPKSTFYIRKTHLALSILNYPKEISYFKYECSLFNSKKSKQDKNTNRDDNKFPRR